MFNKPTSEDLGKIAQIFEKVAKTVAQLKRCENVYIKAQFESPKQLHQTPSELVKYLQHTML
jgi:hypothetical protein